MMSESPPSKPPPDLETLQYNAWDPEFSADMSAKMRVPDSIRVAGTFKEPAFNGMEEWGSSSSFGGAGTGFGGGGSAAFGGGGGGGTGGRPDEAFPVFHASESLEAVRDRTRRSMTVPQRILVAGDEESAPFPSASTVGAPLSPSSSTLSRHAGLDLDFASSTTTRDSGVQLSTPPEVLTVGESKFPTVYHDDTPMGERHPRPGLPGGDPRASPLFRPRKQVSDGVPGFASLQGSVNDVSATSLGLMTPMEESSSAVVGSVTSLQDETLLLRRHVAKLGRRVNQLEQDNLRRTYREYVVYPLAIGYFLFKFFHWIRRGH